MRRINVKVSIGFPSACREGTIEVEDDISDDELEDIARDFAFDYIEWNWSWEDDEDE